MKWESKLLVSNRRKKIKKINEYLSILFKKFKMDDSISKLKSSILEYNLK